MYRLCPPLVLKGTRTPSNSVSQKRKVDLGISSFRLRCWILNGCSCRSIGLAYDAIGAPKSLEDHYGRGPLRLRQKAKPFAPCASVYASILKVNARSYHFLANRLRPLELPGISFNNTLNFLFFFSSQCFKQLTIAAQPTTDTVRLESSIILSERFALTLTLALGTATSMPACSKLTFLTISSRYIWKKIAIRKKCQF